MLELNRLMAIIDSLSEDELNYIHKSILLLRDKSNSNKTAFNSKVVFELLRDYRKKNDWTSLLNYLNDMNRASAKKGLQRMTERILELLVDKEMLFNNNFYDNKSREVFIVRRKLMYYDVLASHGVTKYALSILEQVIIACKNIEYYDYLLMALDKKLIKMSLRNGEKQFNSVYKSILFYSDCQSSLRKSMYMLRFYNSNYQFKQKVISLSELRETIRITKKDYFRTQSKNIGVVLYYMQGMYYFNQGDNLKSKQNFLSLYSFLNKNNEVVNASSYDTCILNIAECETLLFNFTKSTYWISKISNRYLKNEFNSNLLTEMKFLNNYYSGDLVKCQVDLIQLLLPKKLYNISKFVTAKQNYYFAIYCFLDRDYYKVNKELRKCHDLDSDKDGWNIGVRFLSIVNCIELEKYNLAESLIENLRKYLNRVIGSSCFLNRSRLISKILNSLVINSFDYELTFSNVKVAFSKLSSQSNKYKWIIKSPEMIPFHEWFDAKVKNVPYNHVEAMKRLKKLNTSKA